MGSALFATVELGGGLERGVPQKLTHAFVVDGVVLQKELGGGMAERVDCQREGLTD
jgi:hypothetical protein